MAARLYKHAPDGKFARHHPIPPAAMMKARARAAWLVLHSDGDPATALAADRRWAETLQATRFRAQSAGLTNSLRTRQSSR